MSNFLCILLKWFWASIQMDACADESMYSFWDLEATPNSQGGKKTPKTLSGGSKTNKRKRLRENLAQLASDGELDAPLYKRCSLGAGRKSLSASFLDATADTSAPLAGDAKESLMVVMLCDVLSSSSS